MFNPFGSLCTFETNINCFYNRFWLAYLFIYEIVDFISTNNVHIFAFFNLNWLKWKIFN